jgi:secreted PhoX family phosphatase
VLAINDREALLVSTDDDLAVVKLERPASGRWRAADPDNRYNRRITGATPFQLTGPAAGDPRLRATEPSGPRALGTCFGGTTPWGTVLAGQQDLAQRIGWLVEIDPFAPASTPRKHTMLGRLGHDGVEVHIAADGRAVVSIADAGLRYRFVSADTFDPRDTQAAKLRNLQLLTRGTLHVARGSELVPLASDTTSYVGGMGVADVLVDTRLAAAYALGMEDGLREQVPS